jgi:hypothetical protein
MAADLTDPNRPLVPGLGALNSARPESALGVCVGAAHHWHTLALEAQGALRRYTLGGFVVGLVAGFFLAHWLL